MKIDQSDAQIDVAGIIGLCIGCLILGVIGIYVGDQMLSAMNTPTAWNTTNGIDYADAQTRMSNLTTIAKVITILSIATIIFALIRKFMYFQEPDNTQHIPSGRIINPTFVHNNRDTVVYAAGGGGGGGVPGTTEVGGGGGAVQLGGQHIQRAHIPDGWEPVEAPQTATPVSTTHPVDTTTETHNKHESKRTRYNTLFEEDM